MASYLKFMIFKMTFSASSIFNESHGGIPTEILSFVMAA